MIDKLKELLVMLETEATDHRKIANELCYSEKNDRLNDKKYHDGMADMANVVRIKVLETFRNELKPDCVLDYIDDGIDLNEEY